MQLSDLIKSYEDYQQSIENIQEKRALWSSETKDKIFKVLTDIISTIKLDWRVQKVHGGTNQEAVNIHFNNTHSGIVIETSEGRRALRKTGRLLVFTQAYNGDIFVLIEYPHVEEIMSQVDNKLVDKINPKAITEEYIVEQVQLFLNEMTKWETSTHREVIGFK